MSASRNTRCTEHGTWHRNRLVSGGNGIPVSMATCAFQKFGCQPQSVHSRVPRFNIFLAINEFCLLGFDHSLAADEHRGGGDREPATIGPRKRKSYQALPIEIANLFIILIALSLRSAEEQYLETRASKTAGERASIFIRPMIDHPPRFSRFIVTRFVPIDLDFVPNSRHRTHLEILCTTLASARE
jgi:hypothetical protein